MPFGYVPHYNLWKDIFTRVFGYPNMVRRIQAPLLMKMLAPRHDEIILDVGCGNGFFTFEIAARCRRCIGIDLNLGQRLLKSVKQRSTAGYLKGNVETMPLASAAFDKLLLSSVLQMVKHDRELLSECHRVLKENGTLVLSVPLEYIHIKSLNSHKSRLAKMFGALGKGYYSTDEVLELLTGTGFEVIRTEYSPKWWGSLIFETGLYLNQRFGFPFLSPLLFPVLYPVAWFDRFAGRNGKGNEFIIEARKVAG